ncbi:hypothetical protein ACFVX9_26840 [Kitasatospora sp. NPDC058243]|uniref:hypothetical protein n=1 Tax=Kitasatospora sp. NPDC058243 TaxID=3346397 RepID=UPI0036DD2F29
MLSRLNAVAPGSSTSFTSPGQTSHSLGGVPLGVATDSGGQLKNYPNLFVVDGSPFPGGGLQATPPALTITAPADRLISGIAAAPPLPRRPRRTTTHSGDGPPPPTREGATAVTSGQDAENGPTAKGGRARPAQPVIPRPRPPVSWFSGTESARLVSRRASDPAMSGS